MSNSRFLIISTDGIKDIIYINNSWICLNGINNFLAPNNKRDMKCEYSFQSEEVEALFR